MKIFFIYLFVVNFITSLYNLTFVDNKILNKEDIEKDNIELSWCGSQLIMSIFMVWLYLLFGKLYFIVCLSVFCIITTSISWDHFGRKNINQYHREIFMFLTLLNIFVFFRLLE